MELSRQLRALLPKVDEAAGATQATAELQADWLGELRESDRLAAFAETIAGGAPLLAVSYVPDEAASIAAKIRSTCCSSSPA